VSIDDDLIRKVRVIASSLGMTVPDYVNHRLRPVVDEELPRVLRQLGFKPED
jgi:antitoxin component of RelBE/YafQ-DinJ toxin-antitoxin module